MLTIIRFLFQIFSKKLDFLSGCARMKCYALLLTLLLLKQLR